MRLVIRGHHLPGRRGPYDGVRAGLQVGRSPEGPVAGAAPAAEWGTGEHRTDDHGMPRCARPRAAAPTLPEEP